MRVITSKSNSLLEDLRPARESTSRGLFLWRGDEFRRKHGVAGSTIGRRWLSGFCIVREDLASKSENLCFWLVPGL